MGGYAPLALLVAAVGLAFVGGLAVACFTKLYGIVFLGENRSKLPARPGHEADLVCYSAGSDWRRFAPRLALCLARR